jgi:hypothetical protein
MTSSTSEKVKADLQEVYAQHRARVLAVPGHARDEFSDMTYEELERSWGSRFGILPAHGCDTHLMCGMCGKFFYLDDEFQSAEELRADCPSWMICPRGCNRDLPEVVEAIEHARETAIAEALDRAPRRRRGSSSEDMTSSEGPVWGGYHGRGNPWRISVWPGGTVIEVQAEPDKWSDAALIFGNGGSAEAREFAIALLQAAEAADELSRGSS